MYRLLFSLLLVISDLDTRAGLGASAKIFIDYQPMRADLPSWIDRPLAHVHD